MHVGRCYRAGRVTKEKKMDVITPTKSKELERKILSLVEDHSLPEILNAISKACAGKSKSLEASLSAGNSDKVWNWGKAAKFINKASGKISELAM
jgi:hypothetical protein